MISFPAAYSTFLCITDLVPEGKLLSLSNQRLENENITDVTIYRKIDFIHPIII